LNLLNENLKEKQMEIEDMSRQLENNNEEFNEQHKNLTSQLCYLESNEEEIREIMSKSRGELRTQVEKRQQEERRQLKERQEERREDKMFEFEVKKKELAWLLELYSDPDEVAKVRGQLADLDVRRDLWLRGFEDEAVNEEKELDDREEDENERFMQMEQEQEEEALKDLKKEQLDLLQEKSNLVDKFEEMRQKILDRM
jgi:hypothetical protein